ncbi:MAG: hypothetical protein IPI64_09200 [Chloracidobacterium sp.]|nr:hypothetical protein [Chloracidobacterium sp.]
MTSNKFFTRAIALVVSLVFFSVLVSAQGGYSDLFNKRMNGNDVKPTTTQEDLRKKTGGQGQIYSQFSTILTDVQPAAIARATQAGLMNDIGVTIFDQKELQGNSALFGPGVYRADGGVINGMPNDSAMSLVIGKGYRVMLCSDEGDSRGGAGNCERPTGQATNLIYPRSASWILVTRDDSGTNPQNDAVTVYAGGNNCIFGVGTFMANGGWLGMIPNDSAIQITVPKGLRARLCEHEGRDRNGDGDCEEFGEGWFQQLRRPRTASWIKVWKQ